MDRRTRSNATRSRSGVSAGAVGVKGTPGVRKSSRLQQAQRKQSPTSSGRRVLKNASPATAESAGNGRPSSVQPLGEQQPNRRRQNSVAKSGQHALGSAGNTAPPDATRTGRDAQSTDIVGVAAGSGGGSCNQSKSSLQAAGATAADQPAATLLRDVPSVGHPELPGAQSASGGASQLVLQQLPKHSSPEVQHGARAVDAQLATALAGEEPSVAAGEHRKCGTDADPATGAPEGTQSQYTYT